jgi:serine/threonine protein phosphatase 1
MWPIPKTISAQAPADTRIYAIGDIHGCDGLLAKLLDLIQADAAAAPEQRRLLVYLGDYVDRGPDSAAVIERLRRGPPAGFEAVFLMGNHEALMLDFLADPAAGGIWLRNGGRETAASYGVSSTNIHRGGAAELGKLGTMRQVPGANLPAPHRTFLDTLVPMHREGDYLFVHAGIQPGLPLTEQRLEDLLWIREPFLSSPDDHGAVVVHGHTPVEAVEFRANRINVDTGAVWTDRLTALVLHGDERRLIQT